MTTNVNSGAYTARTGTSAGGIAQDVRNSLVNGASYRFQAKAKLGSSAELYWIAVVARTANGTIIFDTGTQVTSTTYATYTVDFTVPSNAAVVHVYVWKDAGSSYAYADDLTLVRTN